MTKKIKMFLCVILVIFYYTLLFWGAFRVLVYIDARLDARPNNTNIPISEVIPWGIWESEDPPLILYITPEYRLWTVGSNHYSFPAFFRNDDEYVKLIASFSSQRPFIGRHHPNRMQIRGGGLIVDGNTFNFVSEDGFKIIDGLLRVETWSSTKVYIFHPAKNYPNINTEDGWLNERPFYTVKLESLKRDLGLLGR